MKGFTRLVDDPSEKRIGIGVIGYGFMGKVHSNAWLKAGYSFSEAGARPRLVAMCGRDEARVRDTARGLGFDGYYTDWHDMVADPSIQVVDVCTPDPEHCAPAIAAAQAGKHVICEKPLAMTVKDAAAMAAAVKKAGVTAMLCHNYRFFPAVRLARDLVTAGTLGTIYHFRATVSSGAGSRPCGPAGGLLVCDGREVRCPPRHRIARHRHGAISLRGDRHGERAREDVHHHAHHALRDGRRRSPPTRRTSASWSSRAAPRAQSNPPVSPRDGRTSRRGRSTAPGGAFVFDLEDPNHLQCYTDDLPVQLRGFTNITVTDPHHPLRTVYLPPGHNAGWEYGHVHALHHFVTCVDGKKPIAPLGATFDDGLRIQQIMEATVESSRTGRKVTLP